MNRSKVSILILTLLVACAAPGWAKKLNPNVDLDFRPQQAVAGAEANVTPDMLKRPVTVRVKDLRPGDELSDIGTRTDDDDRKHTLHANQEVEPFIQATVEELLEEWGIRSEEGADLVLEISLVRFSVLETNQALGATYNATVRFAAELSGAAEWSGGATGDATRYGKKFSNANVNEVLSDALLEALAALVSEEGLHEAWEQ